MRNISKRVICALSSAVLLCGAAAIPANAADFKIQHMPSNCKPTAPTIVIDRNYSNTSFILKQDFFVIDNSEQVVLEVVKEKNSFFLDSGYGWYFEKDKEPDSIDLIDQFCLDFQWYDENGPIEGATSYTYTTNKEGKYYCGIYVKNGNYSPFFYDQTGLFNADRFGVLGGSSIGGIIDPFGNHVDYDMRTNVATVLKSIEYKFDYTIDTFLPNIGNLIEVKEPLPRY